MKLIHGDSLVELKTIQENSVDSIVCDPPYELGFMGKSWDSTGIASNVDLWKECLRVLKPGGHLLAFSGTRTYHRMASAIEDAGFEVRDMITWAYGQGFPKSLNIGKKVDKLQGNEREFIEEKKKLHISTNATNDGWKRPSHYNEDGSPKTTMTITKGTSEWEGWGTALKPSIEPICMARKPLSEKTVAENCLRWKTGGINIDISRVVAYNELNNNKLSNHYENTRVSKKEGIGKGGIFEVSDLSKGNSDMEKLSGEIKEPTDLREDLQSEINNGGQGLDLERGKDQEARRVYSNQQDEQAGTSGSDGKTLETETATERDSSSQEREKGRQQSGELGGDKSGTPHNEISQQEGQENGQTGIGRWPSNLIHDNSEEVRECFPETGKSKSGGKSGTTFASGGDRTDPRIGHDDNGGNASRFFKAIPQVVDLNNGEKASNNSRFFKSIIYQAKASKSERNKGCEGLEEKENLQGLDNRGRTLEREDGSKTLVDRFSKTPATNNHPTVKPIALMEYLIKMVTQKGGIVLDPFMGSGSTGVACKNIGMDFIGVEMNEEYIEIAKARINN